MLLPSLTVKFFSSFFNRIRRYADYGTHHEDLRGQDSLRRRVKLVNLLCLITTGFAVLSFPFDVFTAPRWMLIEDLVGVFAFASIPLLNKHGKYLWSRVLFLFFGNAIIFSSSILMGPQAGMHLMFFSLAGFGAMLFDASELRWMIIAVLVPVAEYFYSVLYGQPAPEVYFLYSSIGNFLFASLSVFFLLRASDRMDIELKHSRAAAAVSEKMAALGEMSSGVAHEINTPLTILQLNLLLLKRRLHEAKTSVDIDDPIEKIEKMVVRITGVTRAMQSFSRSADLDPVVSASVESIIQDTLELCRERFKNTGVRLMVEPIPKNATLKCRPVEVSQVLLNLLNNALHAVSELEEKWVRVKVTEEASRIRMTVTDSGKGISDGIRDKIFQPFFTTKGPGLGTGLGLSVSKGIVESHHGQIYLSPESSHTEFIVEFPK